MDLPLNQKIQNLKYELLYYLKLLLDSLSLKDEKR
jgi:hypothetical protein